MSRAGDLRLAAGGRGAPLRRPGAVIRLRRLRPPRCATGPSWRILAVSPAGRRTDEVGPMTRAEHAHRTPGQLAALLIDASTEAIGAAGGHSGRGHLRSANPGMLRLAVLA